MPADYSAFSAFRPTLSPAPLSFSLSAAELSALMASRLCHDLISPVGAVANAMELYDDGLGDEETLQLIRLSAANASARLQFARLAYGSAGSAGDSIGMAEAERLTRGFLGEDKITLHWQAKIQDLPKDAARLLLNMAALAAQCLPRGGAISVLAAQEAARPRFLLQAEGTMLRLPPAFAALYQGTLEKDAVSAHNIQFYWTLLLSAQNAMPIAIAAQTGNMQFLA